MKRFYTQAAYRLSGKRPFGKTRNGVYNVRIDQMMFGKIRISPTHGYADMADLDKAIIYPDLAMFLVDWKVRAERVRKIVE